MTTETTPETTPAPTTAPETAPETATAKETLGFQSEIKRLLHLMVHSLYSNREIFLRELISNASDANDKLRFAALTDESLHEGEEGFQIEVDFSPTLHTITVTDNGIGMSRAEVIEHIGTIAKSGTDEFFHALTGDQQHDAHLIGQFGVGFYAAFTVADRVTLSTRRAGLPAEEGVRWESDGGGEYTIERITRRRRGTEIRLHLKEDAHDLLDGWRLREIVRRYSDHISYPITMPKEAGAHEAGEGAGGVEGGGEVTGHETVNQATALWQRPKKEIEDKEYAEFYKHIAHDYDPPLAHVHSRVEGHLEYTTLFYIPAHAPFDLWDRQSDHRGVKLYVRRVFIMDDAEKLLPRYLRYIRGVVDSADLPLNVSREILQHNKVIEIIRNASVKKILGMIEDLAGTDLYPAFWSEFGRVLKEGVVEDPANRERIAALLRFSSTRAEGEGQTLSLADYIGRMREGQKEIYYLVAEGYRTARASPHLEIFRQKAIEVLLLWDPVDEWVMSVLTEFDGRPLRSVAKGALDLGEIATGEGGEGPAQEAAAAASPELRALLERMGEILKEEVREVRATHRLTTSPACLVADRDDMALNLRRILEASGQKISGSKPVLEVNPGHPLIHRLCRETNGERIADWSRLVYDQSVLAEGGKLEDPAAFVHRLNELLLLVSREGPNVV